MKLARHGLSSLTLLCFLIASPAVGQDSVQIVRRIGVTATLAAQEYQAGVRDGRVVAAEEVKEAGLFFAEAIRVADGLPAEAAAQIRQELVAIVGLVERTAPPESVTIRVTALVSGLATRFGVVLEEVPTQPPSQAQGAALFQTHCARCHGDQGRGDGPEAARLDPPPARLADSAAMAGRTPLDFYRRIAIGVAGTAMPAFEGALTADERWAVAFYVASLHRPADAVAGVFIAVRRHVDSVGALARAGRYPEARQAAFDAYLAFEGVERRVAAGTWPRL